MNNNTQSDHYSFFVAAATIGLTIFIILVVFFIGYLIIKNKNENENEQMKNEIMH